MCADNGDEFLKIARERLPLFSEGRLCPDQFVGEILINNGLTANPESNELKTDFLVRQPIPEYLRPSTPSILLVLESPHTTEYAGCHPRPAAGNGYSETGRAIREIFCEAIHLHKSQPNGRYPLFIINAIQFQCSLGNIKKHRDAIFRKCWTEFAQENFRSRFLSIYKHGDITINACTAGKKPKVDEVKIRELIKIEIEKITSTSFEVQHPASWRRIRNTAIKRCLPPSFRWQKKAFWRPQTRIKR